MYQSLKSFAAASKINSRGKTIPEKLVIIESDDWGAIRTPSRDAIKAFENRGLDLVNSIYKADALASKKDLEMLFEVLLSFKGADGRPVKLTANAIMANPDFERIKESGFQKYYYELFTKTFERYPEHQNNFQIWKRGWESGIFHPQFHGREHLNYKRWLKTLRSNNSNALYCFDWNATFSGKEDYSFMEAYDWDSIDDIPEQKVVIAEGLMLFEELFGFKSKSFIAPCYNWDTAIEPTLFNNGVRWLQGIGSQLSPTGTFGSYVPVKHAFGDIAASGLHYNIRNCHFEPSMNPDKDWVSSCLAQIASAFLFRKPAVICSHRINFVGFIDPANRDRGLRDLTRLLKAIVKKWPDVRFVSTDEL